MNKKEYREVFSKIQPSDEAEERIMNMTTNRKNFSGCKRVLVTALVVISLLCSVGVFANAATDGAVGEAISEAAQAAVQKVIVFINGEKTQQEIILQESVGEDGETHYKGEISITVPDGEEEAWVEFEADNEGVAIGMAGEIVGDISTVLADEFELYIPTTVQAE